MGYIKYCKSMSCVFRRMTLLVIRRFSFNSLIFNCFIKPLTCVGQGIRLKINASRHESTPIERLYPNQAIV